MSFEPIWGAIIAWYLFLAGLGGGAFITSAFLGWRHPEAVSMRKVGHLIAPIAVIIGLVLADVRCEDGPHEPAALRPAADKLRIGHDLGACSSAASR
ncbi:MAG: NrfD/PsrC family molybdoenzyme membrane anchor subunit [Eggerthellaceae bacterium]